MGALSGCVATVNGCMRDDPVQAAHLFRIVGDSHASRVTFQMFELCVRCVRLIRSPVGGSFSLVAVCRFAVCSNPSVLSIPLFLSQGLQRSPGVSIGLSFLLGGVHMRILRKLRLL